MLNFNTLGGGSENESFWGYEYSVNIIRGHHKTELVLGVISMQSIHMEHRETHCTQENDTEHRQTLDSIDTVKVKLPALPTSR